jgi:Ca2+-transporting ATPase
VRGLTSFEAKKRLKKFGPNVLPETPPPSDLSILVSQLKSPLVYVLIIAGIVTFFLKEVSDTVIISFVVILNTLLGFFQERRANKALHALKQLIHPKALVLRDGKDTKVDVSFVVPGDIVVLKQGDKIPADGKLTDANRFTVEEAILTGESVPVDKSNGDEVFMGTIVAGGQAKMSVVKTGKDTKIGEIALSVQKEDQDTPLKKQLSTFSKQLSILVLVLTVFVFIVGILSKKSLVEIFTTSVALAVSSIPEGLLVALTMVLAIGMQRILARRGLVRNLVSAETLGGVTTICVDKTGTLTLGKLKIMEVLGNEEEVVKQTFLTRDDPIAATALEWVEGKAGRFKISREKITKLHSQIDYLPFAPQNRFFASLVKNDENSNLILANGAPELLLKWSKVSKKEKKVLLEKINNFTENGMRVIGMAKKQVSKSTQKLSPKFVRKNLTWVGALVISDPPRPGVSEVLKQTLDAGINILVITGDYAQTAQAVLRQLEIKVDEKTIVVGSDLKKLSIDDIARDLKVHKDKGVKKSVRLFARIKPMQKLKIVEGLKKNGETVAMMGDGVNDAPALKRADIGIVVGEATDVAKESADLVLLDSSFATIVAAIEEGRGIFDNIRKIILYLMSDAFEEIIAVVGTIILGASLIPGLPLPVTAAQILWINLVSDGFPHLALTVDPKHSRVMKLPPRDPREQIVAPWMRKLILIISLSGGIIALSVFIYFYTTTGNLSLSQSVAFATLGVNSLIYVFSVRTLTQPFWKENPFDNKWLNVAVIVGMVFQVSPFMFEKSRHFLELKSLSLFHWVVIFTASIIMFIIIEVSKKIFRRNLVD